ncbi:hypothetical protein [Qipengyuania pacifica]|uniref:hypothetical protein n=1 Tax=Qipengyuania pacifica TaxID=2860199 RepID=UPI001C9D8E68|nr:hypothetical protein [Qipengyuania pacifica]MBY8333147.1 hypothetical protein [Qipengyuania pacifica]
MTSCPSTLAAVRVALAQPFADPVNVGGLPMRRAEARALERLLTTKPTRHPLGEAASASVASTLPGRAGAQSPISFHEVRND